MRRRRAECARECVAAVKCEAATPGRLCSGCRPCIHDSTSDTRMAFVERQRRSRPVLVTGSHRKDAACSRRWRHNCDRTRASASRPKTLGTRTGCARLARRQCTGASSQTTNRGEPRLSSTATRSAYFRRSTRLASAGGALTSAPQSREVLVRHSRSVTHPMLMVSASSRHSYSRRASCLTREAAPALKAGPISSSTVAVLPRTVSASELHETRSASTPVTKAEAFAQEMGAARPL